MGVGGADIDTVPVPTPVAQGKGFPASAALHKPRKNRHKIICGVALPAQDFCVRPVKDFLRNQWLVGVVRPYPFLLWQLLVFTEFKNGFRLAHHGMTEIHGVSYHVPYDGVRPFILVLGVFEPFGVMLLPTGMLPP